MRMRPAMRVGQCCVFVPRQASLKGWWVHVQARVGGSTSTVVGTGQGRGAERSHHLSYTLVPAWFGGWCSPGAELTGLTGRAATASAATAKDCFDACMANKRCSVRLPHTHPHPPARPHTRTRVCARTCTPARARACDHHHYHSVLTPRPRHWIKKKAARWVLDAAAALNCLCCWPRYAPLWLSPVYTQP